MSDLQTQPADAYAKIEALKARRGAALLDGDDFDDAEIVQAEAALVAIDNATAEQVRRQREAANREFAQIRNAARRAAKDREAARLAAIAKAEQACCELVAALNDVTAISLAEHEALIRLGVTSLALGLNATAKRVTALMAPILAGLRGSNGRQFGDLKSRHIGRPDGDWKASERSAVNLENLIGEK